MAHDERNTTHGTYSFHTCLWYLPDGFSNTVNFRTWHKEPDICFYLGNEARVATYQGIIWFPISFVQLTSHQYPIKKGAIGVPIGRGNLPPELSSRIRWKSIEKQMWWRYSFLNSQPSWQTIPDLDLRIGAFYQGTMRDINDQRLEEPFTIMGNLPYEGHAPYVGRRSVISPLIFRHDHSSINHND